MFFVCVLEDDPEYLITGTHAYPSGPGKNSAIILTKLNLSNFSRPTNCTIVASFTPVFHSTGVALTADTKMHRNPSEGGVHSMALALPPSQAR